MNDVMKANIAKFLCRVKTDAWLRVIHKKKLLILTYHGICNKIDQPSLPLFTHLNADTFRWQLEFIKKHYQVISLSELSKCLLEGTPFPEKSVMISFDDGFRNNYEIAFPILQELDLPAVVFLAVDYVSTDKLLWFDELFLALRGVQRGALSADIVFPGLSSLCPVNDVYEMYKIVSAHFKDMKTIDRFSRMSLIKDSIDLYSDPLAAHFKLMTWDNVRMMRDSKLVEFGVHTATHRILSGLSTNEYRRELVEPRVKLSKELNCGITSFCYPNGVPDVDFFQNHEKYLEENGYACAFSTHEALNSQDCNRYRMSRFSVGNDMTSNEYVFRLRVSGFFKGKTLY